MQDPESIVKAFIGDYYQWNDRSRTLCASNVSPEMLADAEHDYELLLSRYCKPGFRGQAIAFGFPSAHDPNREEIKETRINGDSAIVRTTKTDEDGFQADYEFILTSSDGRWFLEAVDYIDDEGRYPGL